MLTPHFPGFKWVVDVFSTYAAGASQPRGRLYDSTYRDYRLSRYERARHAL